MLFSCEGSGEEGVDGDRVQRPRLVGALRGLGGTARLDRVPGGFHTSVGEPRREEGRGGGKGHDGNRQRGRQPAHRTHGRTGRDQHAEREEERRADGQEVPVVVDEPVQRVQQGGHGQGKAGCPLLPLQPAQRPAHGEQRRETRAGGQQKPNEPGLGEGLERQVVRLRDDVGVVAQLQVDEAERACAGAPDRVVRESFPRLLPPAPTVVGADAREPLRLLGDRLRGGAGEVLDLVADPVDRARERKQQRHGEHGRPGSAHRGPAKHPVRELGGRRSPLLVARGQVREPEHKCARDAEHHAETDAVVETDAVRLAVLGEPRPAERPGRDRHRRQPGNRERRHPLEPAIGEYEPDPDRHGRHGHAATGVGEQESDGRGKEEHGAESANHVGMHARSRDPERQRQAGSGRERERVPVLERVAQACEPERVLIERRGDLARERPGHRRTDEGGQPGRDDARSPRHRGGDEQPEHAEGPVGETAVRVAPRQVGPDRPPHAEAAPEDDAGQEHEERGPDPTHVRQRQPPQKRSDACHPGSAYRGRADQRQPVVA